MNDQASIDSLFDAVNKGTLDLARAVSLAVRIEPELLRLARVRLFPGMEPGVEADLWFSPLVQSYNAQGLVLLPEVTAQLRQELAEVDSTGEQTRLHQAWEVVRDWHTLAAPAVALEEQVTYLSLLRGADQSAAVEQLLQSVAAAMSDRGRSRGLARWVVRALPNLPKTAQTSQSAALLALAASAWLGGQPVLPLPTISSTVLRQLPALLPDEASLTAVPIGVRLLTSGVELSNPPVEGARIINAPPTTPVVLQVALQGDSTVPDPVTLMPGEIRVVPVSGPGITIATCVGRLYTLRPVTGTAPGPRVEAGEDLSGAEQEYLRALRGCYLALRDQFTPVQLNLRRAGPATKAMREASPEAWTMERLAGQLVAGVRLLLHGRPGGGKSTMLRRLALQLADATGGPIPVVASLRSFNDVRIGPGMLRRFIHEFLAAPPDPGVYPRSEALASNLESFLTNGRLAILLDQYNEVWPLEQRLALLSSLREFIAQYPLVPILVATRAMNGEDQDEFWQEWQVFDLKLWSAEQVADYLGRNAADLQAFAHHELLAELVALPVQLVHLVAVLRSAGADAAALLENPNALIQAYFLDRLFGLSELTSSSDPLLRIAVEEGLNTLALRMARTRDDGRIDYESALSALARAAPIDALRLLQVAADATILDIEPGTRRVGFMTRRLQAHYRVAVGGGVVKAKKWANGKVLRVRFLDGDPAVHAKLEAVVHEWEQYANIKFVFGSDPDAEVRVSFKEAGTWSAIGTDALVTPANQPTSNFGWLAPTTEDEEYRRVVLHEFGHVLGMIHEHQNPSAFIPWDRDALYRFYMGPPNNWSRAAVDTNVLQKYDQVQVEPKLFDPHSIMIFPVPDILTLGQYEIGWNRELSPMDILCIRRAYPFPETQEDANREPMKDATETMDEDMQALKELSTRITEAENRGDREWLASVLAPRLAFQRADGSTEDRDSFLQRVEAGGDRVSRIIEPVYVFGDRAVLHCIVTTRGRQIDNLQLFVRRKGEWKLLAWANQPV